MTHYKNNIGFLALGISIIALSGCGYNHPNSMPGGYTYHHETYKSPVSAASSKVTIEQRQYMDETQAEQFRSSVYELLERLTMRAGLSPKPVYVLTPNPLTTFYANIDNDLREGMRHIGYAISDMPLGAYVFTYEATPIIALEGQPTAENVQLTIRVFSSMDEGAVQLTEETGKYYIQGAEGLDIQPPKYGSLYPKIDSSKQMLLPPSVPVTQMEPMMAEPMIEVLTTTEPSLELEPVEMDSVPAMATTVKPYVSLPVD